MASGIPDRATAGAGVPRVPGGAAGQVSRHPAGGWTAGRVVAVVAGAVLALVSLGLLGGGGVLLWADQALRAGGYVTTGTQTYSTSGYALASEDVSMGWGWLLAGLVGSVRIRASTASPDKPVFLAIGPADQVTAYLSGVDYTTVRGTGTGELTSHDGTGSLAVVPQRAGIWVSQATGTGTQTLRWTARAGDWMAVAMNPGGSAGLSVRADAGVSAPGLFRLAVEVLIGGALAGAASAGLILVAVRLAAAPPRRAPADGSSG